MLESSEVLLISKCQRNLVMDILRYCRENKCICAYRLPRDDRERSVGSAPNNNCHIQHENVDALHIKIKFEVDCYKIMVLSKRGVLLENSPIPLNRWIKLSPDKKIWLDRQKQAGYLIYKKIEKQVKKPDISIGATQELLAVPRRGRGRKRTESADSRRTVRRSKEEVLSKVTQKIPKIPRNELFPEEKHRKVLSQEDLNSQQTQQIPSAKPSSNIIGDESLKTAIGNESLKTAMQNVPAKPQLELAPDLILDQDQDQGVTFADSGPGLNATGGVGLDEKKWIAGRYRLLTTLGKGGMGIVYKVMDEKLKREVALKLLIPKERESLEAVQRFLTEARSMARLKHKNIVGVHDIGTHENMTYFTMDFVEGKELQECLEDTKPRQIMQWMLSVCKGIQYVHNYNIIHRDLKPSNVMISKKNNEPILMDFGIARDEASSSDLTARGQSIGTPAYMAPEQARGLIDQIDCRTDIYGLGAILYEALTKQAPFSGQPMQVIYKVCTVEPTSIKSINPTVPQDVITIVEKAMSKDKETRYQSAGEMAEDIKRYLDGLRIHAQPPTMWQKLYRRFKHDRHFVYITSACAAVLILMLGSFLYSAYSNAAEKRKKIQGLLTKAENHLRAADTDEDETIANYIQATDCYSKILNIESKHKKAFEGKSKGLIRMADYAAIVLQDYNFARMTYKRALQMRIQSGSMLFRKADLKNAVQLMKKLRNGIDKISYTLKLSFTSNTRKLLDKYETTHAPSEELKKTIISELNLILGKTLLYEKGFFRKLELSSETKKLLKKPTDSLLIRLNRMILENSYTEELRSHKGSPLSEVFEELNYLKRIKEEFALTAFNEACKQLRKLELTKNSQKKKN